MGWNTVATIKGPKGDKGDTGNAGSTGPAGTTDWNGITNKPSTYPPVIGSTATTAVAGNDSRLTDTRTPTDNSVTSAKIVDGSIVDADISGSAAIALSKLATGRITGLNSSNAPTNLNIWVGTAAAYAALAIKDNFTLYFTI